MTVLDDPGAGDLPDGDRRRRAATTCSSGASARDPGNERALDLWVVSDNLRKGAATNAVQIAELLHARGLLRAAARAA